MIYNLGVLANISDAIRQALRTLMGHLAALIYTMIEYLYNVFIYISRAEILDNEFIQSIYQKVGMILGIFMIFKLIFSLIQSLIDPDKFADKKSGYAAIIQRSVIAIVLLGITPSLFREAFKLQNLIVGGKNSDNVIYKLIAGKSPIGLDDMGRELASDLYFSFYTDEEYPYYDQGINDTIPDSNDELNDNEYKDRFVTENYDHIVEQVKNKEMSFDDTVDYLSLKYFNKYRIEFNEILSIGLGIIVAWMLITYCIQAGARVIQLAYLQLIAPVPILSYISDPDGAFKKWIKQCTTTFLDLFIRLAIIYFVMTLIGNILIQFSKTEGIIFSSTGLPTDDWFLVVLVKLFIILGLMLFAKKVPELLKDLFPNMGGGVASLGFGINPKKTFNDIKDSPLTKVGLKAVSPAGRLAKKTIGGIDSARAGYGFKQGWKNNRGSFGTWLNKQRETYTPYSYEQSKNRTEGMKKVNEIDANWNDGVKVAEKLMKKGLGAFGTANGWEKAFDGTNRNNYKAVFKHDDFITSKMNLDAATQRREYLKNGLLQVQAGGSFTDAATGTSYNSGNVAALSKLYNTQEKTVSGLEDVHTGMQQRYSDDAKTEKVFKFIKNNEANPANPKNTRTTKGIQ